MRTKRKKFSVNSLLGTIHTHLPQFTYTHTSTHTHNHTHTSTHTHKHKHKHTREHTQTSAEMEKRKADTDNDTRCDGTSMERAMHKLMRMWKERSAVTAIDWEAVAGKFVRAAQKDVCGLVRDEELFRYGIDAQQSELLACVKHNLEVVDEKQWSDFAGEFADATQGVLAERTGTLTYFDRWVRAKEINIKKEAGKKSLYHVFYDASQLAKKYTGIEVQKKSGEQIGTTTGKAARPTASSIGMIEVQKEDGTKIWLRGFGRISATHHIVCDEDTEQVGLPDSCDVWMPIMMRIRMENSVFCTVCHSVIKGMMMVTDKKIQCKNCASKDDAAYDKEGDLIEDGCWMDVSVYLDSKK